MEHPKPNFPEKFWDIAGMVVTAPGSSCANCKFLKDAEKKICGEPNFIEWNFGSDVIPATKGLNRYCSIWWEPREGGGMRESYREAKHG
ncbi:MAG TPA: hypothetical protein VF772_17545 [Terriglobales bacterium]